MEILWPVFSRLSTEWIKENAYSDIFYEEAHSFSKYAKFSGKLTFITPLYAHARAGNREVSNVSFSENFAYALNEWAPTIQ